MRTGAHSSGYFELASPLQFDENVRRPCVADYCGCQTSLVNSDVPTSTVLWSKSPLERYIVYCTYYIPVVSSTVHIGYIAKFAAR